MSKARAIATMAVGYALCASAAAQAPDRVPTVSRLVKVFSEQEIMLGDRLRAGDTAAAGRMLTDDFELRAATRPARPVPRADWLAQAVHEKAPLGVPTDMAVHDLGNDAIVSYRQSGVPGGELFVVDVWRRDGNDWKLAIRYAAANANGEVPGVPAANADLPKKY